MHRSFSREGHDAGYVSNHGQQPIGNIIYLAFLVSLILFIFLGDGTSRIGIDLLGYINERWISV